ncbi:MAG TPA: tetratricopeptide repeat protein [Verrucomicrobiae bacterium]
MDTPWYRKMFSQGPTPDSSGTRARAEQGDADAQFDLGVSYGSSAGELLDFAQAAQWYRKAAEQNHSLAQFNLGVMYAKGQGVAQDDAEAARWIRKAADRGDAGAQFNLGTRFHRASMGRELPDASESRVEAYKWFQLAAAQGYKDSISSRDSVTRNMTRAEVTEGNQRATGFVPQN